MRNSTRWTSILQALLAAIFFGLSAPLAKVLLGEISPLALAGLLYLGSGLGTLIFRLARKQTVTSGQREARLTCSDIPWMVGAVIFGGVAAPIVLLFSLRATPASTASLLLNFEGVATTLLAFLFFREAIGARVGWAVTAILLASILLSRTSAGGWGFTPGALGILAACFLWGLDNNFTRNISAKDPLQIVTIKGLVAGGVSLVLAWITGSSLPSAGAILLALLLGAICYGLSIVLFVYAMRGLGAVRTSALFSVAPFVGAGLSLLIFKETLTWLFIAAFPLMLLGAWLLMGERHEHIHLHPAVEHEHHHSHSDEHHSHVHADGEIEPGKSHSHLHTHPSMEHSHPHSPDIHHRHSHR